MAALTTAQRIEAWAELQRADTGPLALTKDALRAALDAADTWVEANSSAFNVALPQPARNALTARQKALLLLFVVDKRYRVL